MEGLAGGGVGKYKMQSKTKLIITLGLTRFQYTVGYIVMIDTML